MCEACDLWDRTAHQSQDCGSTAFGVGQSCLQSAVNRSETPNTNHSNLNCRRRALTQTTGSGIRLLDNLPGHLEAVDTGNLRAGALAK